MDGLQYKLSSGSKSIFTLNVLPQSCTCYIAVHCCNLNAAVTFFILFLLSLSVSQQGIWFLWLLHSPTFVFGGTLLSLFQVTIFTFLIVLFYGYGCFAYRYVFKSHAHLVKETTGSLVVSHGWNWLEARNQTQILFKNKSFYLLLCSWVIHNSFLIYLVCLLISHSKHKGIPKITISHR